MANVPARVSRASKRWQSETRILEAARQSFAEHGYERTTIRGVAGAANVDPGLVIHYFSSKEELFAEATQFTRDETISGTPDEVAELLLASLAERLETEPTASLALLRSMLTHREAKEGVRGVVAEQLEQISRSIGTEDAGLRASLISATILGVIVGRHLLEFDWLKDASPQQIIELLRPGLLGLTGADPAAPGEAGDVPGEARTVPGGTAEPDPSSV